MLVNGAPVGLQVAGLEGHDLGFCGVEGFEHRVVHVLRHATLVLTYVIGDASHRYAVSVKRRALYGDSIFGFGQRFSEWMQAENSRVSLLYRLFEFQAEAGNALGIGDVGL